MRILTLAAIAAGLAALPFSTQARPQWTPAEASAWYAKQPWQVGSNFIPSDAINQLEMWQADTFNPALIDKERELARALGVTQKTAWFMLARLRMALHGGEPTDRMNGIVEADETYIGGKARTCTPAKRSGST